MNADPFSQDVLNRIFTISPKYPDRLMSRESSWLEFKEVRAWGKYIRSAAAFANAKGGYIVYGVANSPHKLIGLKDDRFDQLTPKSSLHTYASTLTPELEWDRHRHELSGRIYGILYFHESRNKPVMCRRRSDDGKLLKEG